jgi:signal transduction histidine kinase
LRVWEEGAQLRFEVGDSGVGFSPDASPSGKGIANMHDRLEAVGGMVRVSSGTGAGTVAAGYVPLQSSAHAGAPSPAGRAW